MAKRHYGEQRECEATLAFKKYFGHDHGKGENPYTIFPLEADHPVPLDKMPRGKGVSGTHHAAIELERYYALQATITVALPSMIADDLGTLSGALKRTYQRARFNPEERFAKLESFILEHMPEYEGVRPKATAVHSNKVHPKSYSQSVLKGRLDKGTGNSRFTGD